MNNILNWSDRFVHCFGIISAQLVRGSAEAVSMLCRGGAEAALRLCRTRQGYAKPCKTMQYKTVITDSIFLFIFILALSRFAQKYLCDTGNKGMGVGRPAEPPPPFQSIV